MIRLGVNIDHVATVRQARRAAEPDPVAAAVLALLGGADGITIHLREDRRHIQDREVACLKEAAAFAKDHGLHLHAGHGLTYANVKPLVRRVPGLEELNIGHSIVSRAVLVGMERAVREMKEAIREACAPVK